MYNEQQELLNEVYRHYLMEDAKILPNMSKEKMTELGYGLTQEEFINKCKTNPEFSEKWGLQIEERGLSLEERATIWNNTHNPVGNIYTHNQYDENDIPTKLITITKITKIESYE
jgi:hypothetical protein